MSDLILSLNSKILKVTLITNKGEFKGLTKEIPNNICADSRILDVAEFSSFLDEVLSEFVPGNRKNYSLNFLIEPENTYSEFIEMPNTGVEDMEAIVKKAKHQLEGVDLNELYYTLNRLAPFVRHFVGVKKIALENYIEIAQNLKMELKSVIPWNFLLPKYTNALEPSLFIVLGDNETVFSLSEMNNIYFSKGYDRRFKPAELESYVRELANYDKTSLVKKVYLLGKETLKLDDKYELIKISLPNAGLDETHGFESHLLGHYMLDFSEGLLVSPVNMLSLLPMPTTVKTNSSLVYVGAALSVLVLLGGVIYGGIKLSNSTKTEIANNTVGIDNSLNTPNVAGANTAVPSATEPAVSTTEPTKPLEKKDLNIMIENGAGVAGLASKTKLLLEKLGYKVYDIGDAEITGRENTLLKFKKDNIGYKDILKEDLKDKYLDIVVEDDLSADSKYDVLLIVGTKVDDL